jgi:hypothetical protein
VLAIAYVHDLHDFAKFLLLEKLGPRTLQSLALIAEVVHNTPSSFSDPARYSFAYGGKDRHPFPVPLNTYDDSLNFLRTSLEARRSIQINSLLQWYQRLNSTSYINEKPYASPSPWRINLLQTVVTVAVYSSPAPC